MPRPRVLPSQRQRASEACNSCREAKKKCSGTAPCTHCLRRGIGDSCFVEHRPRGRRNPPPVSDHGAASTIVVGANEKTRSARTPIQTRTSLAAPSPTSAPNNSTTTSRGTGFHPLSPSESRTTETDGSAARVLEEQPRSARQGEGPGASLVSAEPSSRMLLNLRGERVYIGGGGSLSFLQLVRRIVSEQIGPSPFSRNGKSDTMLEKESPQSNLQPPNLMSLSSEAKLMCADYFYAVTGGLIDVFVPHELEALLTESGNADPQKGTLADLVMAIGLQCEPCTDTHDRELAYFRDAQSRAFAGMLEDPDIDMVRIFLIMSFYLLGECRRNTAFLYLGIATRAAVALGLHSRETYTDMTEPKHQLRLRVWMSLRVLDIVVNSILGRPAATAGIHSDLQSVIDNVLLSSTDNGLICLGASYNIVGIINAVVHRLYDRKDITVQAVEEYLQQLEHWSQGLPGFLRTSPSSQPSNSSADKGSIGRIHVSCLYYFAVTMATRPILVSTLMQQPTSALVHSQLASACLDAAMFIVQTCSGAKRIGLLQGNMCILKAIIFPAGLVLGFELFAKGSVDYGVESAFNGARELLSFLGEKSPQAALYQDILTSLATAITEYRQRALEKGKSSYVSKIFNFDRPQTEAQVVEGERDVGGQPSNGQPSNEDRGTQMDDILATLSFGQNTPVGYGDVFLDWDTLDISQWDSFPYLPG